MRISDRCLTASTFALTIAIGGFATAQAPRRVDTPTALAQIVKKVDPVVPPEAAKANVGGVVIADVVIGPAGTVSSVSILSGHMLLHAAAERAMRQWTFKPFLAAGRRSPYRSFWQ
jgi:TonB family protein